MPFVLNPGQGTLHINDKAGNDARPDRRGEINIGGTIYQLSGWIKQGPKGPWLSLVAELPMPKQEARRDPPMPNPDADSIPF